MNGGGEMPCAVSPAAENISGYLRGRISGNLYERGV